MDKQEPVAWMWDVYNGAGYTSRGIDFFPTDIPFAKHTPLYTAPPQHEWVGLTDDEYFYLQMKIKTPMVSVGEYINAMKMVEEKLKDKNGF